jgi:hypothetical protein
MLGIIETTTIRTDENNKLINAAMDKIAKTILDNKLVTK